MQIEQVVRKLKLFKGWETKKLTSARNFNHNLQTPRPQAWKFSEIARNCVKLNFRK